MGGEHPWSASDRARLEATVRGRVQAVGYRYFVIRMASALELDGWVANRPDGGVECVAEGPRAALEQLEAALREGPPAAWVDEVAARWLPATGALVGFTVRPWGHPGD